ncbi:MAG: DUF4956 domain-containing protein [Firmicutes bacterium]|nr:DUF4956 domain-containing protein [Bacillota bacterium]
MLNSLFASIYTASSTLTLSAFLISLLAAIILGGLIAAVYGHKSNESRGFLITLAVLPAIVSVIIMMVNGSLGASVAVAGAFSLVRFRSNPGTAREICAVFLAMSVGLACGIGYPGFAALFTVVIGALTLVYEHLASPAGGRGDLRRVLKITVPEDLNYYGMFDDIFEKYTTKSDLAHIKTTSLGSLNKLSYQITLRGIGIEKEFIDELRCRNGNLEISLALPAANGEL